MGIVLSLLRILTSSWLRRLLPAAIAAGLIVWFWDTLLHTLGAGIVLVILVAALLVWLVWKRRIPAFMRVWNWWLSAVAFAAALLGVLAFFNPGYGVLKEVSLGGDWGIAIIGDQTAAGGLRVLGALLVGLAFIGPHFTLRFLRSASRRIHSVLRRLTVWTRASFERLHELYLEHPVHERVVSWVRRGRAKVPEIRGVSPHAPQPDIQTSIDTIDLDTEAPPAPTPVGPVPTPAGVVPARVSSIQPAPTPQTPTVVSKPAKPQLALPFLGRWQLPSTDLLDETARAELSQTEVERRARLIEESLASYGVEAKVVQINVGPAVTQFGIDPGWDRKLREIKEKDKDGNVSIRYEETSRTRVKVERITSLSNNLALALAAHSVRIEAPIPGTSLVGIEVPNSSMGVVSIRDVLESPSFQKLRSKSKLAMALGEGTAGEVAVSDLAKMPHVLIAGATGSGKTVCLDSIIISLLMNNSPEEMRFIMIDPKRVELIAFNGVPHLTAPVVTESERAVDMLKWLEHEMDSRYRKLASVRAHNVERYNKSNQVTKPMPYLVVVVDELADLMMAVAEEFEPRLCRLAQMGRAVGIHLVVATQRPSVDVITGLIKANFPTRISFAVVSQVDSRTILDMAGAEKLLGRGDMLFNSSDMAKPKRLQGCFTSPEEMERVVNFWREQARLQPAKLFEEAGAVEEDDGHDPLLEQARQLAKDHKQVSSSFLQRQLRIGYARAEKLMQLLEQDGQAESDPASEPES